MELPEAGILGYLVESWYESYSVTALFCSGRYRYGVCFWKIYWNPVKFFNGFRCI